MKHTLTLKTLCQNPWNLKPFLGICTLLGEDTWLPTKYTFKYWAINSFLTSTNCHSGMQNIYMGQYLWPDSLKALVKLWMSSRWMDSESTQDPQWVPHDTCYWSWYNFYLQRLFDVNYKFSTVCCQMYPQMACIREWWWGPWKTQVLMWRKSLQYYGKVGWEWEYVPAKFFKMYLSQLKNVLVQIDQYICPKCQMFLSKFLDVFVTASRRCELYKFSFTDTN